MAVLSYHLRVQKEIERRMFLDVLSFVDRLWPIRDAVYIGMGSVYFEDFKGIHDRFGVKRMICLERQAWLWKRQEFNLPLSPSCIELRKESVSDFLNHPDFEKELRRRIVWLDFDSFQYIGQHLNTFVELLGRLQEGDVVKITIDSSYGKLKRTAEGMAEESSSPACILRLVEQAAKDMLGEYFPYHIPTDKIACWLKQKELGRVLTAAAIVASQKGVAPGFQFSPLAAFLYSDQSEMLTFTGIVSQPKEDMIGKLEMEKFPFTYRKGEGPYRIAQLPIMTPREKMAVDQCLPLESSGQQVAKVHKALLKQGVQFDASEHESLELLKKYAELYRYHPDYRKINP